MPTLRIMMADGTEVTHTLRGDRVTIGRRPDNTIQILDRSVSGYHAELIHEGDHYRLHDLGSTNLSFVEGDAVMDFHLHEACKLGFGNIQAQYDAAGMDAKADEDPTKLTPAQMEKDMAFLRAENQDLLNKINGLERRIDILSNARLVIPGKSDTSDMSLPEQVKKLTAEREEQRYQVSGLKLELEKVREELATVARERDHARQDIESLRAKLATEQRQQIAAGKGDTQKIALEAAMTEEERAGATVGAGS